MVFLLVGLQLCIIYGTRTLNCSGICQISQVSHQKTASLVFMSYHAHNFMLLIFLSSHILHTMKFMLSRLSVFRILWLQG
jgi:hypothetical protein